MQILIKRVIAIWTFHVMNLHNVHANDVSTYRKSLLSHSKVEISLTLSEFVAGVVVVIASSIYLDRHNPLFPILTAGYDSPTPSTPTPF